MTREELDAIRERLAAAKAWKPFDASWDDIAFGQSAAQDVEALLAEVELTLSHANAPKVRPSADDRIQRARELLAQIRETLRVLDEVLR